jgi:hypothetical protein
MRINKKEWKPWIERLEKISNFKDVYSLYFKGVPEKYVLLVALAYSVAKWHPNNFKRGHFDIACGLCVLQTKRCKKHNPFCGFNDLSCNIDCDYYPKRCSGSNCILIEQGQECGKTGKIWHVYEYECGYNEIERKKLADKMYELLLKLYSREYIKCFPQGEKTKGIL